VTLPHDTIPVPLASILQRWQSAWRQLYLAEQHGVDAAPADLLAELQSGAHIARLVTAVGGCGSSRCCARPEPRPGHGSPKR
jgi:hypothetical protein